MFTAGNPGLSPPQKCPEPLPDLHHIQREVCNPFESPLAFGAYEKKGKCGDRSGVEDVAPQPPSCFSRDRLLIYGKYCSHVETAIALLDYMCKDKEDVRMKLEVRRVPSSVEVGMGGGCLGGVWQPAAAPSDRYQLFCSGGRFSPCDATRTRRQAY